MGISPEVFADFLKILYGWEFGPTALQKPEIQFMHRVMLSRLLWTAYLGFESTL